VFLLLSRWAGPPPPLGVAADSKVKFGGIYGTQAGCVRVAVARHSCSRVGSQHLGSEYGISRRDSFGPPRTSYSRCQSDAHQPNNWGRTRYHGGRSRPFSIREPRQRKIQNWWRGGSELGLLPERPSQRAGGEKRDLRSTDGTERRPTNRHGNPGNGQHQNEKKRSSRHV